MLEKGMQRKYSSWGMQAQPVKRCGVERPRGGVQARSAGERAVSTRTISLGAGHPMTVAAAARLKSLK